MVVFVVLMTLLFAAVFARCLAFIVQFEDIRSTGAELVYWLLPATFAALIGTAIGVIVLIGHWLGI